MLNDWTVQDLLDPEKQHPFYLEQCRRDVSFFIERYVQIEDRDSADVAIPFKLWPQQIPVLLSFVSDRLIQVLKARQLGLTWLALSYAVWQMVFKKGYSVIALSKTDDDAKELVRRVVFILRHLPSWMINETQYEATKSDVTIKLHSEYSTFQSFPASANAGRSFTANLVILDEWAFQQWAREIWRAAYPSINRPSGGQVIGLSTIERGTLFEDLWIGQENGFKKIFLPWYSDPRRDQDWYEKTKAAMGDGVMSEYPATVEEAFAIPGGAFFTEFRSVLHIKPAIDSIPEYFVRYRLIDYGLDMLACYWLYIDTQGNARIYRELHVPELVISEAAYEMHKLSGACVPESVDEWSALTSVQKNQLARTATESIYLTYAPPDLFNRQSQTGRPSSEIWQDNGITLTKTKNDIEQGCIAMTEWLHPIELRDEQTGAKYSHAKLTIDEGVAPKLIHSLLNIQKDKHRPKIYAKEPHILTHSVDALRGFCTEYEAIARKPEPKTLYRDRHLEECDVETMTEASF